MAESQKGSQRWSKQARRQSHCFFLTRVFGFTTDYLTSRFIQECALYHYLNPHIFEDNLDLNQYDSQVKFRLVSLSLLSALI